MTKPHVEMLALYVLAWHVAAHPVTAEVIATQLERLITARPNSRHVPEWTLALKVLREEMLIATPGPETPR